MHFIHICILILFLISLKSQSKKYLFIPQFLACANQDNYSHRFISKMVWGIIRTYKYDNVKSQVMMKKLDLDFLKEHVVKTKSKIIGNERTRGIVVG